MLDVLTVKRSALSRYPRLDPANMQRSERINATRTKSSGINAIGRMIADDSVQQRSKELVEGMKFYRKMQLIRVVRVAEERL